MTVSPNTPIQNGDTQTMRTTQSKIESLKNWSISTYKCTKQLMYERLGKTSRTVDFGEFCLYKKTDLTNYCHLQDTKINICFLFQNLRLRLNCLEILRENIAMFCDYHELWHHTFIMLFRHNMPLERRFLN